ncbi:MAG: permease-like cell division protein FtsX [Bacillota bacterium]|nr:permease-like cell division protein FtsX [Bacillota bacterium]MDW7682935.1 permease-like cell division protein FtsX [Bacillota bacterium]
MLIRNWVYYIKEAFRSIFRNGWMSFASIAVVAVTLFILGSFMLLNINVEQITEDIKGQVEIIAYVDETVAPDEVDAIRIALIQMTQIEEVRFVTREEALDRLKEELGELVDGYEEDGRNPLRDSFEIRTIIPEDIPAVATELEKMPGIAKVVYGEEIVGKLFQFTGVVQWVGLAFMAGLALTAMFLIANTIRLTVNARSKEIKIMKYVGATEWFIRWPFLIEGVFLGFFGALIPTLMLMYIYGEAVGWTSLNMYFLPLVAPEVVLDEMAKLLLLLGTAIGGFGSLISIRRFLRV